MFSKTVKVANFPCKKGKVKVAQYGGHLHFTIRVCFIFI